MIYFAITCIVLISSTGDASIEEEDEKDPCNNTCQEWETCLLLEPDEKHQCICFGFDCGPDPCNQNPCQNGGACEKSDDSYYCSCVEPYIGKNCTDVLYSCDKQCKNGGTCKKNGDEMKCECTELYSGSSCETELVLETSTTTITNTTKIASSTSSTVIDFCYENPCENGGTCKWENGGYKCACSPQYSGTTCEKEQTILTTIPSTPHGLETTPSITTTQTHSTLISSSAKVIIDFCFNEPCQNGGTCKTEIEDYKCICSPLYSGNDCEEELEISTTTPTISTETTFSSTNSPTVEPTTTSTTPRITRETTMPSTAISTQDPNITTTTPRTTFETTMSTKTIPTQEPTTTSTARGTTREPKLTTTSEGTTIDDDLCISSPCLNNGSCISIDNSVRCNCTYPFSGELCGTDLSEKNQSSSNSIVYACTGSAGAIVIVFLIGFSVLWHLKRVKRRKKENYFHNADLSSMESENSRTYII